jgi:hypothetical protein
LLFGTGDLLERAVFEGLSRLNLKVSKTEKAYTADLLAQTADGSKRFGFEVTGTNGPIRKDSKKLTRVLDLERLKEHDEKVVLIASTFNATPPVSRGQEPDFTAFPTASPSTTFRSRPRARTLHGVGQPSAWRSPVPSR